VEGSGPLDGGRRLVAGLELSTEQLQAVDELVAAKVAVEVYRQVAAARRRAYGDRGRRRIASLDLSAEQAQGLEETVAANIAVQVYRQLQTAQQGVAEISAGCKIIGNCSNGGGCNIIGNCSSCSELATAVPS
jgi:hypothetical protein